MRLLENTDILVENYKVGGLSRYGLAFDQIKERFPRLVYCSITGFGQTGPYATRFLARTTLNPSTNNKNDYFDARTTRNSGSST